MNFNVQKAEDHALFGINALVLALRGIVPLAFGLVGYSPLCPTTALSLCVIGVMFLTSVLFVAVKLQHVT